MSAIKVANLQSNSVGVPPAVKDSADTEIGQFCRAWVSVDSSSGTPTILDGFNVSSITDDAVGIFTVNFTNNMGSSNYAVAGMVLQAANASQNYANGVSATAVAGPPTLQTAAGVMIRVQKSDGAELDMGIINTVVFSN